MKNLLDEGAKLSIYDPKVTYEQIKNDLPLSDNILEPVDSIYQSVEGSDAIVILTEWDLFKTLDWNKLFLSMRKPSWLFDTRGVVNYEELESTCINLWRLGYDD